jgi:hypothetical protein
MSFYGCKTALFILALSLKETKKIYKATHFRLQKGYASGFFNQLRYFFYNDINTQIILLDFFS